jgi:hypothetical protein
LRKLAFLAVVFSFSLLANLASAQQADVALGFGALMSPSAASCEPSAVTVNGIICPEKGGVYPSVGFDVIFRHRIGFGYDVAWRGGQGAYGYSTGQPYRPIINSFNAVFQPRLSKKIGLDLSAGVGLQSTRYYGYSNTFSCNYLYACYTSSHHLVTDFGGGIRYYILGHLFVRPEVRYYFINNNTADFTSNNVIRVGGSIGYTIGGPY